ncbi:MAG TPA: regulatory protein RecX [Acidothermaceae bacterium]
MSGSFGGRRSTAGRRNESVRNDAGGRNGPSESVDPDEPIADPTSVARSIGLNLLDAAPKTRAQLAEAMRKRGVPDDAANEVLDRFEEVGLLDDAAFANAWVTSRQSGRGLAPRALSNELRQRGIAEPLIAEAVGGVDSDDVEAAARDLVTRRARATAGMPNAVRMRRLVAILNRKGYSGELAVRVVREVLAVDADELADIEGGGGGAVGVRRAARNDVVGGGRYTGPSDAVDGRDDGPSDVVVGIFDRGH